MFGDSDLWFLDENRHTCCSCYTRERLDQFWFYMIFFPFSSEETRRTNQRTTWRRLRPIGRPHKETNQCAHCGHVTSRRNRPSGKNTGPVECFYCTNFPANTRLTQIAMCRRLVARCCSKCIQRGRWKYFPMKIRNNSLPPSLSDTAVWAVHCSRWRRANFIRKPVEIANLIISLAHWIPSTG